MKDKESRTEEATPKRLRDSRKKGQVSKSGDLNSAVSFFVFALFLSLLMQYLYENVLGIMYRYMSFDFGRTVSATFAGNVLGTGIFEFFKIFLPFGLLAMFVGIGTNLFQVGFLFTLHPLKPDFKRLNPIEGFKNIFSIKAIFNMVKSILKLMVVVLIAFFIIQSMLVAITNTGQIGTEKIFPFFIDLIRRLSLTIASLMIVLGVIDFVFQKREFKKNMKMTKQEVREEHKDMEGDPQIKSKRKQIQREMSMQRMMAEVMSSDVVVTNPTHLAIALRYKENDKAPVVTAKGTDFLAARIREKAQEENIPIIEDKPLARMMYHKVEPGMHIPVELYQAVAEVLALVYQMEEQRKGKI